MFSSPSPPFSTKCKSILNSDSDRGILYSNPPLYLKRDLYLMAAIHLKPEAWNWDKKTKQRNKESPTMVSAIPHLHFTLPLNLKPTKRARNSLPISPSCSLSDAPQLLRAAARHTVDTFVKSGMVIGLGSGQASGMAVQYLGQQLRDGSLKDIIGVPTSVVSASEAAKSGIPLVDYQDSSQIDFAFDDVDIIEEGTLIAVIGRQRLQGEESIIQEKSILNAADQLAFMVSENQYKGGLDGSIPVLIQSLNWMKTAEEIEDLYLGDAEVWRRPSIGQAGPLGGDFPVVTREGHNILDVIFTSPIKSLAEVAESLDKIEGVVDHGVISKYPCRAVITSESGLYIVDNIPTRTTEVFNHTSWQ